LIRWRPVCLCVCVCVCVCPFCGSYTSSPSLFVLNVCLFSLLVSSSSALCFSVCVCVPMVFSLIVCVCVCVCMCVCVCVCVCVGCFEHAHVSLRDSERAWGRG